MDHRESKGNNPDIKCRWSSYGTYKLILWAWMMNETTLMFTPSEVSLLGFYMLGAIQICVTVFVGIPLLYSEICIAQYTNCNIITMWDFFPILRYVGFATLYLIILKTIYFLVLTSWYLEYSFYGASDPPPWYSCADFNDTKCMVKSVNVSVFQHCLEAESQFADDCGMKTASNCFFEREIGGFNTKESTSCFLPWKTAIASTSLMSILLFFVSVKRVKFLQIYIKFLAVYVCIVVLVLFCAALSKSGTWYASSVLLEWNMNVLDGMHSLNRGVLSLGTGCGIVIFLTRDIPFRSPATMTTISVSLLAIFFSAMFTLIAFSGIKSMVYFHGEELNVVEIGTSVFFVPFACITEILNYFDAVQLWSFAWFTAIFLCLFSNLWIMLIFLGDLLLELEIVRTYRKITTVIFLFVINFLSWPFFCSDLTAVLTDAIEIMQLTNNLIFSFSLYWMYGLKNHNIDITFMIGTKASYFWKISWLVSPLLHALILYGKWTALEINQFETSYYIESVGMTCDLLLFYFILLTYHSIIFFSVVLQVYIYYREGMINHIFSPAHWGPKDQILYKSRKMFVPEIMTTEFLYRQVRVRGYGQGKRFEKKPSVKRTYDESSIDVVEWSAQTSN